MVLFIKKQKFLCFSAMKSFYVLKTLLSKTLDFILLYLNFYLMVDIVRTKFKEEQDI